MAVIFTSLLKIFYYNHYYHVGNALIWTNLNVITSAYYITKKLLLMQTKFHCNAAGFVAKQKVPLNIPYTCIAIAILFPPSIQKLWKELCTENHSPPLPIICVPKLLAKPKKCLIIIFSFFQLSSLCWSFNTIL